MIKRFLLGIGITLLGLINFSNAGKVQLVGLDSVSSIYNNQYNLTFLRGGGVLTNYLGQGKSVLALNSNIFFRWATNGLPYFYGPYSQGFFSTYCACDEITNTDRTPENANCTCNPIVGDAKSLFKGFFTNVKQNDYAYYDADQLYGNYPSCSRKKYQGKFCRSSANIHSTLCLAFKGECYNGCQGPSGCDGLMGGGLVNSQGLQNLTYGLINNSWIGYAPGQNGYDGQFEGSLDGSSEGVVNVSLTGDYVYVDCTFKDIIIALESEGYNKYVCYGGLDNFEHYDPTVNYMPIAGTGLSISQIWAYSESRAWDNFPDFFRFWNGLYIDDSNDYTAMWSSYPAVYRTYFQIYNTYKGDSLDPRTLLEYCQLLNMTGDSLNASVGGYFKPACETIIREKQTGLRQARVDGTLYSGGIYTGDVPISVNWNGVGNMSGLTTKSDGLSFLQDFFNLSKSKLTTNYVNNFTGIIPGYIIVFMIALILFRFLSR